MSSPRDSQFGPLGTLGPLGPLDQLGPGGPSIEFQEIPHSNASASTTDLGQFHDSSALLHPDTISSSSSEALPLPVGSSSGSPPSANASFYQLAYYQHWFDVTTTQIRSRLLRALIPTLGTKFYHDEDPQPDFYGPFWICTTLIFLLAASGNFASYITFILSSSETSYHGNDGSSGATNSTDQTVSTGEELTSLLVWTYDFKKVSVGASVFYAWISLIPLLVYCAFARMTPQDGAPQKGFVEIASLFGYGLAAFLPVCILCIPPVQILRWISVSAAFLWSSYFLIKNLGADVHNKAVFPVIAFIVILNLGLSFLTKLYFFDF